MKLYRQRPVVVEAEMYNGTYASATKIVEWAQGHVVLVGGARARELWLDDWFAIEPGDYVVRNTNETYERYSPSAFGAQFEPVLEL